MDSLRSRASNGEADALYHLAERHEQGDGVTQDLAIAAALYDQAARRGHAESYYRIGLANALGLGLSVDLDQAFGWLTLAAVGETPPADLARSLIESIDDDIDDAGRARARTFADSFDPIAAPLDDTILALLEPASPVITPESSDGMAAQDAIEAVASDAQCGTHEQAVADDQKRLVGFTAGSDGRAAAEDLDLVRVTAVICDALKVLGDSTLVDPTIDLVLRNQDGVVPEKFSDGDLLVIDAAAGDRSRRVFIDYVVHDGSVVHLFPTSTSSDNRMPASPRLQIGGPGADDHEWQVGPPFGNDLVIFYSSEEPLHDSPREAIEPADGYLRYLRQRLSEMAAETEIGIDYHVLRTAAR